MNTPRKHHYLPQVHIRKFTENSSSFVFSKIENKWINVTSSENIFVAKDLNSTIDENTGETDHIRVENEITALWDNNFNFHYDNIIKYIKNLLSQEEVETDTNLIQNSLQFFFEYSIVNQFRSKKISKHFNQTAFSWFDGFDEFIQDTISIKEDIINSSEKKISSEEFSSYISFIEEFKFKMTNFINQSKTLRFPAPTITEAKIFVPSEYSCDIFLTTTSSFILPDCTAILNFSEKTFKWQSLDINKIHSVGIPINPYIYLQIKNSEVNEDKSNSIYNMKDERVKELNENLARCAYSQFLTIDKEVI